MPQPEPSKRHYKVHRFKPQTSIAFEDYMRGLERKHLAKTGAMRRVTADEALHQLLEMPEAKEMRAEAAKPPDRI